MADWKALRSAEHLAGHLVGALVRRWAAGKEHMRVALSDFHSAEQLGAWLAEATAAMRAGRLGCWKVARSAA